MAEEEKILSQMQVGPESTPDTSEPALIVTLTPDASVLPPPPDSAYVAPPPPSAA